MKAISRISKVFAVITVCACLAAAPVAAGGASEKVVTETVQYTKDQPEFFIQLAKQEIESGRWWAAEKALKKAKRLDPEKAETYRLMGDIHKAFSRTWKADKFYKKADELEQKNLKK